MKVRPASVALWVLGTSSLLCIAGIIAYATQNASGHTGVDPYLSFVVFGTSALSALIARLFGERTPPMRLALIAGIVGMAIVAGLDQTNRLDYYDRWIERGMP